MRKIDPATLAVSEAMTKQTRRIAFLEEANAASHKHCDELRAQLTAAQQQVDNLTAENAELRRLTDRHDRDYAEAQKRVDRLRELLRECRRHIYADCLGKELVARIDAELLK